LLQDLREESVSALNFVLVSGRCGLLERFAGRELAVGCEVEKEVAENVAKPLALFEKRALVRISSVTGDADPPTPLGWGYPGRLGLNAELLELVVGQATPETAIPAGPGQSAWIRFLFHNVVRLDEARVLS
jgi:hypothetical protein